MKTINIGCNGLIVKNNKLLLGVRKNCYGAGSYGLPGGHLEYGEKLIDATKREMLEECGIKAIKLTYNSTLDQVRPDQHYIQVNFVIDQYEGNIENSEPDRCEGWEWFNLDELPNNIFPPHVEIIESYKQKQTYNY
jgi:8-oxo-dGTP diphosphatase